ncbi:MAG: sugar kinase [Oribacterium sp.]|nr:sugar kinase [Oribacterium sp.]MDY6308250.1 sugar kinase [Oribacterium sp.]MDY6316571.1 sugar kinase [Oribacterium sp.]
MNFPDRPFDLVTMGQLLLRLSPPGNARIARSRVFEKNVGGAELNVAVGASLLGLHTGVISKIPSNENGQFMRGTIRSYGVSDDFFIYDKNPDARLGIYFYEYGAYPRKPEVIYDRRNSSFFSLRMEDIDPKVFESTKCFHTSGITLALSPELRKTTIEAIRRFKEAGALISFDVNFRGNLWTGDEARETILTILPYIDIFFCSESTAKLTFLKTGTCREMIKSFTKDYPIKAVFATQRTVHSPKRHDFGSVAYDAELDKYFEEPPYENIDVVDRIGSGDAYISGALYGLISSNGDVKEAVKYGNATSAMKNTIPGDLSQSSLHEIQEVIEDHYSTGFVSEMNR